MASGQPPGDERGGLGPPPIPFRVGRDQLPSLHAARWLVVLAAIVVLFIVASVGRGIFADYLWFDSLGFSSVYSKEIVTKIWLFFAGALIFLAFIVFNLWLARKLAPVGLEESFIAEVEPATLRRVVTIGLVAGSLFLAVIFGSTAGSEWETLLRFTNGVDFGVTDPAFHKDAAFYIFTLPALWSVLNWLTGAVIVTFVAVVGVYVFTMSLQNFEVRLSRGIKVHVGSLVIALLAIFVCRYILDIFTLATHKNGFVQGVTYTDAHARVPGYYVLIAMTAIAAGGVLWSMVRRSLAVGGGGVVAWIGVAILALGVYPAIVQRFTVDPNELDKESPYIQRNIQFTRAAFGIEGLDQQPFQAENGITRATITQDQATINNIRLWDPRFILDTYRQQQEIQPLYNFDSVDVDRYPLGGAETEVTLAARELSQANLPANAKTWLNTHVKYTHGYGAVMNPVNKADVFGLPQYNLFNIPPAGDPTIDQPRIYFGQDTGQYVVVGAKDDEFDFKNAKGDEQSTRYAAKSGVGIGSLFRRLIYSWEFGDFNLLISGQISGDSRLLYRRNIHDRIAQVAPFLTLDHDPYLVIADGKQYWIQDAFTTTSHYPYAAAEPTGYNYIRNSVKVVLDAYTGDVTFYLIDTNDPIARTYQRMFPSLFTPFSAMPASLRGHLRYPEDLFRIQSDVFRTYHITDPRAFYAKEDLWSTPKEGTGGAASDIDPYYVIMRLPGETNDEFVLIRPFTPANKPNAIALMAARSDGDNYGKVAVYRFPSDRQIPGPAQVQQNIDAQPDISQRFTLLNQQGSKVQRGNLLLIPVNQSLLYVEPVYLQGEQNPKPAVIAVIVSAGDQVYMEPTLSQALATALGEAPATYSFATTAAAQAAAAARGSAAATPTPSVGSSPRPGTAGPPPATAALPPATVPAVAGATPTATDVPGLVREASDAEARAQERLRNGDFAGYGQEQARLRAALDRLIQLQAQPQASPTPPR